MNSLRRPVRTKTIADASSPAAIAAIDEPGDHALFPAVIRIAGKRRFPWHTILQFAGARDLAVLAQTHSAAAKVCVSPATAKRIVGARRHNKGDAAKLLAGAARADEGRRAQSTMWLRRLEFTEGVAAGRVPGGGHKAVRAALEVWGNASALASMAT